MRCDLVEPRDSFLSHDQVIITSCRVPPYFQACFLHQLVVLRERRAHYIAGPPQLLQAIRYPTFGSTFHIQITD